MDSIEQSWLGFGIYFLNYLLSSQPLPIRQLNATSSLDCYKLAYHSTSFSCFSALANLLSELPPTLKAI